MSLAFGKKTSTANGLLYTLLAVWCIVILMPGVVTALGTFGPVSFPTGIPMGAFGWLFALWFVGYLVQFFLFMWINAISPAKNLAWWFVVSALPWAIDWTPSVLLPLWIAVVLAFAAWIAFASGRQESFIENAVHATGVVLQVIQPMMNVVINNVYIKRKVRLRIERDGAPPYEGVLDGLYMIGNIPSPGDRIPLLVDPANPQRFQAETS